ncbi:MAG: hypothetical protein IJ740_18995 [Ruminococcus sp.]|nr:hypothetical protein [Ruminococcus sp.]MBR1752930.1 hypothetical protein [Ruminococcus sp.]
MGMIPKKTKAEIKIVKGLTAARLLGLMMVLMSATLVGQFIGGLLQWAFVAFAVVVYFILTGRSPTDPGKTFFRGLIDFINFKFDVKDMIGPSSPDHVDIHKDNKDRKKAKKNEES